MLNNLFNSLNIFTPFLLFIFIQFYHDNDDMGSLKRFSLFISLIFILKCFTKPFIIRNLFIYFLLHVGGEVRKNLNATCIDEGDISSDRKISGPVVSRLTHWSVNSSIQRSQVQERCSVQVILSLIYCLRLFSLF